MMDCPVCGYDLRASVTSAGGRCPECGRVYSPRDLEILLAPADQRGQPATFPANEPRVRGWLVMLMVIAGAVLGVVGISLVLKQVF